jgi:hypothetical protein
LNFFGIEKVDVVSADQMALDYEKSIKDARKSNSKNSFINLNQYSDFLFFNYLSN